MKFKVHLLLRGFGNSGLMLVLLGKLLLYLTKTLKFSKFPSVRPPLFYWFQSDKLEWRTYQMDYCAPENNFLHCSKRYKNLKNQYFVFSNCSRNLIPAKSKK